MGLTSALFTGLSGLNSNQFRIDTIGDNIANVNTTAFKGSRSMFQTQFAQMMSLGTPPGATAGGTNPLEIGLGTTIGSTQRNMQQGSTETTGVATDLLIDGNGFFVVRSADNRQAYTRDGSFTTDPNNYLVTADGFYLQGYGVDEDFNIVPGVLTDLQIPLGSMSSARATTEAYMSGNLSPSGSVGTQGTVYESQGLVNGGGAAATGATLLTDLRSASAPGVPLFASGDTITVSNQQKGGRTLPEAQFVVGTTGSTVDDFNAWLERALGINDTAGLPGSPGVTINGAGQIVVAGNAGLDNRLEIMSAKIANGAAQPFTFTQTQAANGTSIYTGFTVYDSLGSPLEVKVTMVLEDQSNGNRWRFYAESPDDMSGDRVIGTGTVTFDPQGQFLSSTGTDLTIDRSNTGAASPLAFSIDFARMSGLSKNPSSVTTQQNGFDAGELNSFSIGADGTITGTFRNGLSRTLGQVAIGEFTNPAGLVRETNNLFRAGPNSGDVIITTPGSMGAGRIQSGALELSNVDLSREFIGLINASTGFSAAGKVITTSDKLLNDLLMLTR